MLPLGYDVAWWAGTILVYLLLAMPTLVSIVRHRRGLRKIELILWVALTVLLPLLSLVLWFVVVKPARQNTITGRGRAVET